MIEAQADGRVVSEMHADGGVAMPFFVAPNIYALWVEPSGQLRGGSIYVILNGQLESMPASTPVNTVSILARSFETNQLFQARQNLLLAASFAERNGLNLRFSSIAPDFAYEGSLAFNQGAMRALFDHGREVAARGGAWMTPEQRLEDLRRRGEQGRPAVAPR